MVSPFSNSTMPHLAARLLDQTPINTGEWQSKDISRIPQMATHEVMDVVFTFHVPGTMTELADELGEDLNHDWAEEHFGERVGGVPVNPPPSHVRWPWGKYNGNHQSGENQQFSHTYPERFWPRHAGLGNMPVPPVFSGNAHKGIRFEYGDLQDVVDLLQRSPMTRQAYLPVWFPEDTGAVHRQRVPCTLGYHFMIRGGELSCRYYMRSCDLVRHFTDDVYLASRLMQWVASQIVICPNPWHNTAPVRQHEDCPECPSPVVIGRLTMHIASLHAFTGDKAKLMQIVRRAGQ